MYFCLREVVCIPLAAFEQNMYLASICLLHIADDIVQLMCKNYFFTRLGHCPSFKQEAKREGCRKREGKRGETSQTEKVTSSRF